jgi:hypothetical protein
MRTTALMIMTVVLLPAAASAQARRYSLESVSGLRLHNVMADTATLDGKRGVRLTLSAEGARRLQELTPEQRNLFE